MDLGHRPVNPPARSHLGPVEDELLLDWTQFRHILLFLSIQNILNNPVLSNVFIELAWAAAGALGDQMSWHWSQQKPLKGLQRIVGRHPPNSESFREQAEVGC